MTVDYDSVVTQLSEAIQYLTPGNAPTENPDPGDGDVTIDFIVGGSPLGGNTIQGVQSQIESQPFTENVVDLVIREYQAAFDRIPDQAGAAFWVSQIAAGVYPDNQSTGSMSTTFANSPEFAARYGGANADTIGTVGLVTALYENILQRAPDQAGLDFWVSQDDTAAQLLQAFSQSPEFIADMTGPILAFQDLEAAGTPPAPTKSMFSLGTTGVTVNDTGQTAPIRAAGVAGPDSVMDVFNIGLYGGVVTVGAGGAGFDAGAGSSVGSETVNLTPDPFSGTIVISTADVSTQAGVVAQAEGSFAVVSGWTVGTDIGPVGLALLPEQGFDESADALEMAGSPEVIKNTASGAVLTPTGDGAAYTISAGVISLVSGGAPPSVAQELRDAQTIVDSIADGGGVGAVAMIEVSVSTAFGVTPATFVIESEGTTPSPADIFVELMDVSGEADFSVNPEPTALYASLGGGESLSLSTDEPAGVLFVNLSAHNGGSATSDATYDDMGLSVDTLEASGAGFTSTYMNLNNFAALEVGTLGGGNVMVGQVGPSPVLDLNLIAPTVLANLSYGDSVTANGDAALLIQTHDGASLDIGAVNDAASGDGIVVETGGGVVPDTSSAIQISGGGAVTIGEISGASFLTVDASQLDAELTLTLSQPGLYLSIVMSSYGDTLAATGADDQISLSGAAGSNIDAWLGANSTISLSGDPTVDLHLLGDTAGVALTNLTTISIQGALEPNLITLHFNDVSATGANLLDEAWAGGGAAASQIDIYGAPYLGAALNIAASQALELEANTGEYTTIVNQNTTTAAIELNAHTGLLDWFQYEGDTYIVESVNSNGSAAAHSGLEANDIVVKLTGLVDVSQYITVPLGAAA